MTDTNGYDLAVALVHLFSEIVSLVGGFFLMIYFVRAMQRMYDNIGRSHQRDSDLGFRQYLARTFCRHRGPVFRTKDRWGRHYTGCARCGKDVNQGKPHEEWR